MIRLAINIIFLTLTIILVACQDPKEEIIPLEEIIPKSERYNDYNDTDTVQEKVVGLDSIQIAMDKFKLNGIDLDTLSYITDRIFPERFGPEFVEKYALKQEAGTTNFYRLIFIDSVKTKNALFNWIDCFGEHCNSHFVGEESNFQKNSFLLAMNDTSLIFIESPKTISSKKWLAFLETQNYEPDWRFVIEQSTRGRAKWYRFENENKIKLE